MKVALCLHGYFDSLTDQKSYGLDGYDHIVNRIYSQLDVHPDIYIHSWEPHLQEQIQNLYNPIAYTFQPQIDFDTMIKERGLDVLQQKGAPRSPQSVLSHFYSIQQAFTLCLMSRKPYDVIIKARFDIGRINRNPDRTPVQCITFNPNIESNKLYMADWEMFDQGPADMWFYGDQTTMMPFMGIFNELAEQFQLESDFHHYARTIENKYGDLSNSVIFYKWWMIQQKLWSIKEPLKCTYE